MPSRTVEHPEPLPPRQNQIVLSILFWSASNASWLLRAVKPFAIRSVVLVSAAVRRGTALNAARIFDRPLSARERRRFARAVVGSFYDFVVDVGRCRRMSVAQLRARVQFVEGHDRYRACRAARRGAVLVTAHMGSFEVGLAALMGVERRVHVVFKRDAFAAFEQIRAELRDRLGVTAAPIDAGWPTLMQLRAALEADEAIVIQADRAMPGQRAQRVPFLGGHLMLPLGPVTLARIVGSPIVPVFTIRTGRDRFRIHLLEPIHVGDAPAADGVDPALRRIAAAIESFVARHPEQWLVLAPAFAEDQPGA